MLVDISSKNWVIMKVMQSNRIDTMEYSLQNQHLFTKCDHRCLCINIVSLCSNTYRCRVDLFERVCDYHVNHCKRETAVGDIDMWPFIDCDLRYIKALVNSKMAIVHSSAGNCALHRYRYKVAVYLAEQSGEVLDWESLFQPEWIEKTVDALKYCTYEDMNDLILGLHKGGVLTQYHWTFVNKINKDYRSSRGTENLIALYSTMHNGETAFFA